MATIPSPKALPGPYQVELKIGDTTQTQPFNIVHDPRLLPGGDEAPHRIGPGVVLVDRALVHAPRLDVAPRSLASAISPAIAGALLSTTVTGVPLVICGALKIAYDVALLMSFRHIKPPEERARVVAASN